MPSDRSILERQIERVELGPFTLERFHRRRSRKQRNRRIGAVVVALAVAAGGIGGLVRTFSSGLVPAGDPRSPFLGTWVSTDLDGSTQTMVIRASGGEAVEIVVHDDLASVCSGTSSTMTGTGRLQGAGELVIPSPVLTCDDGSEPEALSGPPLEEQLRNLTFVHDPRSDTLTDNFGSVWERALGEDPEGMWPQSSMKQVREAQRLADAGDPRYTWQVDPELDAAETFFAGDAEIIARFLREELGWQEFRTGVFGFTPGGWLSFHFGPGTRDVEFVRCAPGRTNPLYPNDPEGRGCAPTIDELRYERVKVSVAQPDRRGPSGIWVVTGSRMLPPVEQVVPPSDVEATALLEAFLQARINGEGAQEYLLENEGIPLLYATTSGAPYERFEIGRTRTTRGCCGHAKRVEGPVWPDGEMGFKVRLFAEGGRTVVEQFFTLDRDENGRLGLAYGPGTTENGQPVAEPYSFLDGEVIFWAAPPWRESCLLGPCSLDLDNLEGHFYVLADPLPIETGCQEGPAPADAEALAQSIRSDPDLEASELVVVSVGGIEALRMDVVAATGPSVCDVYGAPLVVTETGVEDPYPWIALEGPNRMRLYLLDLPGGSARILAIAIVAPQADFERVVKAAAPIVDSFEFRTR